MKVDTSVRPVPISHGCDYYPASAAEAIRLDRHGFGSILDPKVYDAVKLVYNTQQALWAAQRDLRNLLRRGDG